MEAIKKCESLLLTAGELLEPLGQFSAESNGAHALADLPARESDPVQAVVQLFNLLNAQFGLEAGGL